jgi:hypothetical protein
MFLRTRCSTDRRDVKCIHSFNGKSERKKPLGLPRRRWEVNTKIGLEAAVRDAVDWSHLSH